MTQMSLQIGTRIRPQSAHIRHQKRPEGHARFMPKAARDRDRDRWFAVGAKIAAE